MKIAIIPCTNQKSNVAGPAREVWVGSNFQLTLAHAEIWYDKVFVMSYKYGLIDPDSEIEPYDIDIRYASAGDRLKWWLVLAEQIRELCAKYKDEIELVALYTGNTERDRVIREFMRSGVKEVLVPWENARVGERMQLIYDNQPPFDEEKLKEGKYTLPDSYAEPKRRGRKPKVQSVAVPTSVEWED